MPLFIHGFLIRVAGFWKQLTLFRYGHQEPAAKETKPAPGLEAQNCWGFQIHGSLSLKTHQNTNYTGGKMLRFLSFLTLQTLSP